MAQAEASLTLNTTTAFLAGVALVQTVAALRARSESAAKANVLGACVCVVAFLHYYFMRTAGPAERVRLRYGDWLITCPLLLWELHELTGVEGQGWALGGVVAMVLLGYAAVQSVGWRRHALFAAASAVLAAVAAATVGGAQRHREAVAAFFGVWALYPAAFLLDGAGVDSNPSYDVLDLVSKPLFGLYVATR